MAIDLANINFTWGEEPEELKDTNPQLSSFRPFPCWWMDYSYKNGKQSLYMDGNATLMDNNIYYLHNLLSRKECEQYMKASEQFGYDESFKITELGTLIQQQSLVTKTPIIWPSVTKIRDNKRLIWQIPNNEADRIYNVIHSFIPKSLYTFYDKINELRWVMVGLNARFRFFKYEDNDVFKSHIDASCASLKNNIYRRSFLSVVIYLNSDFEGGETQFFNGDNDITKVFPLQGSVLLFYHDGSGKDLSKRHCALPPKNGCKYIIRTDLMFELAQQNENVFSKID